jgi:hypothetical protein
MTPEDRDKIMNSLTILVLGQETTNEHLTRLNGKVAKHEESINSLIIWKARTEGMTATINIGWTFILALLSGAVLLLGDFFLRK